MGKYIELSRQALQPIGGMYRVVTPHVITCNSTSCTRLQFHFIDFEEY